MLRSKTLIILLAFVIGVLFSLVKLSSIEAPVKVINVSPPAGAVNVDLNFSPVIQFYQPPESISITTNPTIDYQLRIDNQTATLVLNQPLKPTTQYSLTVLHQGKALFSWSFTTRAMTEAEYVEKEIEMTLESYPLAYYLPFETENFTLAYEAPLYLLVTIKKDKIELIKKEVLDWIQSKGVDPASHRIEYGK